MSEQEHASEALDSGFIKHLNSHGYAFQYAAARYARQLNSSPGGMSLWRVESLEVPVEVQGHSTRIDLLLRHSKRQAYLVVECKRANPGMANWCFAAGPVVSQPYVVEAVLAPPQRPSEEKIRAGAAELTPLHHYHVALELRSGSRGDESGQGPGAIEKAVTQCIRGVNGLVNLFRDRDGFQSGGVTYLLPVVFTTATLWTSTANLENADLKTGDLKDDKGHLTRAPWLCYQYNASPGLKHDLRPDLFANTIAREVQLSFTRTVAIVSPDGLEDFLVQSSGLKFG